MMTNLRNDMYNTGIYGNQPQFDFTAGMNNSEYIFAINTDEKAPIFKVAHYGVVGNMYEIIPQLLEKIKMDKEA